MYIHSHNYVKMNFRTYTCILNKVASSSRVLKKHQVNNLNLDMNKQIINTLELQKYPSIQLDTFNVIPPWLQTHCRFHQQPQQPQE